MNSIFKLSIALLLFFWVSSCVTSSMPIPEKYMLDGQLKRVEKVEDVRLGRSQPAFTEFKAERVTTEEKLSGVEMPYADGDSDYKMPDVVKIMNERNTVKLSETNGEWEKVDVQSLIIRSSNSENYLLVLNRPVPSLLSQETISFNLNSNILYAGSSYLELDDGKYLIERIYMIDGRDKMYAVKNQLKSSK